MVCFASDADWDWIDLLHLKDDLESAIGRSIDLVEREALEAGDNWVARQEILSTAEPIYASA